MIDHLLQFADRDAAGAALEAIGMAQQIDGIWQFASNVCLNIGGPDDESMRVGIQRAVWDFSDPENPVQTQPDVLIPGWYCIVATTALDGNLTALADNACRLVTDREAAVAGDPDFILYTAPDLTQETIDSVAFVEPTFAGSRYPFGLGA